MAHVVVAPDSFKGTFTSPQVAAALASGIRAAGATADECPVADGGEGTLDALLAVPGATRHDVAAHDPLGRPIVATFGLLDGGRRAVVELARASGLGLVAEAERDAEAASTRGTGELIAAAVAAGAQHVLVTVGGSATTDGGVGAVEALTRSGGLRGARLTVLCDVTTPFERAAAVFAPQKGADPAAVVRLTERLHAVAERLPRDPRGVALTGAAGGLSGGLWAACGAELVPGAAFVLTALDFDARIRDADAVVTGEGRLDVQTSAGKLIGAVAERCAAREVPVHAVVGRNDLDAGGVRELGLRDVAEASTIAALEAAGAALGRRIAAAAGAP